MNEKIRSLEKNVLEQYSLLCKHKRCIMHKRKRRTKTYQEKSGLGQRSFWVPALGPGPSSACARVLCMHESVWHAQESCACTRILCTLLKYHTTLDVINKSDWDHKVGDPPFKARKKCWHQMIEAAPEVMERNFRSCFDWPITNLMIGAVVRLNILQAKTPNRNSHRVF